MYSDEISVVENIFLGKTLTEEQSKAIVLAKTGESLKINAFAGTGKSFVLKAIASLALNKLNGLYLAFNKSIVKDASGHFPKNVKCKTSHAIAYAAVGKRFGKTGRLKQLLSTNHIQQLLFGNEPIVCGIKTPLFCNIVLSILEIFCNSADHEISQKHLNTARLAEIEGPQKAACIEALIYSCNSVWQEALNSKSEMPINHSIYLKIWALKKPKLAYDFIMVDEAQDQNEVVIDVLANQKNAQVIWVGDTYQQIYRWRGAVNAMETVSAAHTCTLRQSFRFGQAIATLASNTLKYHFAANTNIQGTSELSAISSELPPNAIICRTNICLISEAIYYHLEGQKVHIIGGTKELVILLNATGRLLDGKKVEHPDLQQFGDWLEVVEFSQTDSGAHLRLLVGLVNQYPVNYLQIFLNEIENVTMVKADLVVSNAHKAKGHEWDIVKLGKDFKDKDDKYFTEEEGNLLYVAITRARLIVDISDCSAAIAVSNAFPIVGLE